MKSVSKSLVSLMGSRKAMLFLLLDFFLLAADLTVDKAFLGVEEFRAFLRREVERRWQKIKIKNMNFNSNVLGYVGQGRRLFK